MDWQPIILGLVVAVIGSGGIAAFFKLKPEKQHILVQSAEKVVVIQSGELKRLADRVEILEKKLQTYEEWVNEKEDHIDKLEDRLRRTERERDFLKTEIDRVKEMKHNGH